LSLTYKQKLHGLIHLKFGNIQITKNLEGNPPLLPKKNMSSHYCICTKKISYTRDRNLSALITTHLCSSPLSIINHNSLTIPKHNILTSKFDYIIVILMLRTNMINGHVMQSGLLECYQKLSNDQAQQKSECRKKFQSEKSDLGD